MGTYELDTEVVVAQPSKAEAEEKTAPEMGLTEDEELLLQIPLVATAILPLTLKAVVGLGIIEILNKGSVPHIAGTLPVMMTAEDIAAQLPTKNPQAATMLDRMLGLLASFNIVRCAIKKKEKVVRRYGPAPFFKWLAKNEHGALAANFVHLGMEQAFFSAGQHLQEAVLEGGIPFEKAHGMTSFQYMATDLKLSSVFNKAMKHNTILTVNKMLETYQGFKDAHVLVDVGGGVGTSLGMIVSKYPHIKGINLDLPHAIAEAAPLPGVEHISGDMFDSIPHGDAILLKSVLHNWSDEHCVKILKNCYMALPNEGKVIVVDAMLPAEPQPTTRSKSAYIMDVLMLINFGGKDRTESEFEKIAKEAGFDQVEAWYLWGEMWVIELRKIE